MTKITFPFVINNVGDPEAVTATRDCKRVTIVEYEGTVGYIVYETIGGNPCTMPAGQPFAWSAEASPASYIKQGTIVGYAATLAGTVNFTLLEEY